MNRSDVQYEPGHFRLIEQIEEEEKAFARETTKLAIAAAKEETEKVAKTNSRLEQMCSDLLERVNFSIV